MIDLVLIHPHLDVVGGSERLTQILLYELDRRGIDVLVLTRSRNPDFFPETRHVRFKYFVKVEEGSNLRINRLTSLFYTLIETYTSFGLGKVLAMIQEPVYLMLARIVDPGAHTSIYIHFPYEEELSSKNTDLFLSMYRFPGYYESMYRFIELRMTNSNYTARVLYEKYGLGSNVVYPAIPWDFFMEEPSLDYVPGKTIISVGRFVPQKRLDLMIKIFTEKIKPSIPDSKLIIIGVPDERYRDYYEKIMGEAERAEDVEVIDKPLKPSEMINYYRESRVYVHLRIGEHFGMAPVEAMTQGVIPVLPQRSGLAELLIHGFNGFIYRSDEEIAEYIMRVLTMDREEYLKMRRNSIRKAQYFNPERFASDIIGYLGLVK